MGKCRQAYTKTMNIFSAINDQSILGKSLRLPFRLLPQDARMPILQGKLRGQKWIVGSTVHSCWLGIYEYEKRKVFENTVKKGSTVFDIGANAGFYTLLSSLLVGQSGRVIAFEPLERNISYLKEHLRINGIKNVEVLQVAVADRSGISYFVHESNHSMGHLTERPIDRNPPREGQSIVEVQSVTIDELVQGKRLPPPSCLKIDVEGGEAEVLHGSTVTIAKSHPTIFLATHGPSVSQECFRLLEIAGYVVQLIGRGTQDGYDEFVARYSGTV